MPAMDTFVIRVYRSGRDALPRDERLRGVVEEISTGFQATFHDTKQLLSILQGARDEKPGVSPGRAEAPRAGSRPEPDEGRGEDHRH